MDCREIELTKDKQEPYEDDEFIRRRNNCTIFLGYTSNMVSSGLRETIRFLVQHKLVDCIVATAGGVEEDFIKCLAPTYVGSFELNGGELRDKGINRIGNLLVPNENYCKFENWVLPLLDEMLADQKERQVLWSPSKMIQRYGSVSNSVFVQNYMMCVRIAVWASASTMNRPSITGRLRTRSRSSVRP